MPDHDTHVRQVEEKVTALSAALSELGRGTGLHELLKIIRFPGYTTPAELALSLGVLEGMHAQVRMLTRMEKDLVAASKLIIEEAKKKAA
jgi:hypothetical protein